jgi:hypothetical protein
MPVHIIVFGNRPRTRVFVNHGIVIHRGCPYWKPVWKHQWFERDMNEVIGFRQANWFGRVRFVKLGQYERLLVRTSNGWFELEAYPYCA